MTKRRVYLALQAVVCVVLAAWLSLSAVSIWREGSARKAEHPMESVYTPEVVAERFAPIAPLCLAGAGLMIAGLALGVKDENAEKPVKDAALNRDLLAARVARPSGAMLAERQRQRKLMWLGRGLFVLCMAPIGVYLLNPAHFPEADLEGMFFSLLRVLLPWAAVGLGALSVTAVLTEKSILRETEAARAQLKAEKAAGIVADAPGSAEPSTNTAIPQAVIIAAAVILIIAGVFNGSARDVLYKAITICTECVGLG